jgi:hypothetical protein
MDITATPLIIKTSGPAWLIVLTSLLRSLACDENLSV